jgi:two-component system chemotaxis response regulator CheY
VPKKVILVDDSKTIIATAQMALEELVEAGTIEVITYLNPVEMLQDVTSGQVDYDLAICDINMPQMNGLDLAEQLKNDARFKNKPILMLTTESSAEMKAKGKAIGLTGWMVKPFSDEKLVKSIKMVLGI